jgi:hypothetical protein
MAVDKSTFKYSIVDQLSFRSFALCKFAAGATCGALLVHAIMGLMPRFKDRLLETGLTTFSKQGIIAIVLGSSMVGAGMSLSNSTPLIAWAQVRF